MKNDLSRSLLLSSIWAFVGRFGYLVIGLITNIVLVRLLGPKEFGQIGIIMFFIIVASVLTESGLSGALVRKQGATDIDYSTIFIFNLVVSIIFVITLIFLSGFIARIYQDPQLKKILIASSFILLIDAFKIIQNTRLIKELQFKKRAGFQVLAISLASIVAMLLAYLGAGVWALVIFQILLSTILTVLLWVFVGPLKTYKFSMASFKSFYKFGINTTLASLLNTAFDNSYPLIIGRFFSITQAGYFYQAKTLQGIPSNIIVMLSEGPIYSALSRLQNSPKDFNEMNLKITKFFTVIVALICLLVFFYSKLIVTVLYGDEWVPSSYYLKLLVIATFFYTQEMFNRNIFKIFNQTGYILKLEICKKTIQLGSIIYGIWMVSIESLLYGFILTSIISFFVNYYYARLVQGDMIYSGLGHIGKVGLISIFLILLSNSLVALFNLNIYSSLLLFPFILVSYLLALHFSKAINLVEGIKYLRLQLNSR